MNKWLAFTIAFAILAGVGLLVSDDLSRVNELATLGLICGGVYEILRAIKEGR